MKKILFFLALFLSVTVGAQDTSFFKSKTGEKLYYYAYGSGPKVVILYGGPGYGCKTICYWAKFFKNRNLIFYDQRGTGLSKNVKMDSSTINLRMAISDIEELRNHLTEDKLSIVGFSWGAGLAMAYASKFPEKVNNLVLISPIGPDMDYLNGFEDDINARRSMQEKDSLKFWLNYGSTDTTLLSSKMITFYTYIPYFYDHSRGKSMLWDLINLGDFNPQMSQLMFDNLLTNGYDVKAGLVNYKGNCTIIRGKQDVISYKVLCTLTSLLPQTKVYEIPMCGHFVDMEGFSEFYRAMKEIFP
jgi:proline iminopeptidase